MRPAASNSSSNSNSQRFLPRACLRTHRLGGALSWRAPPCAEFHDGFAFGEDYPKSYNSLAAKKVKANQLRDAGCPNGMMGIGIAGL